MHIILCRLRRNTCKYLKFLWGSHVYQYTCLPNGLSSAPRIFTKLMKPIYSALRSHRLQSIAYIDDSLLYGDTYEECFGNVRTTIKMMTQTWFMIHEKKSALVPTQRITFLGFVLDSRNMFVFLTTEKATRVRAACQNLTAKKNPSIRELAQVIGMMI